MPLQQSFDSLLARAKGKAIQITGRTKTDDVLREFRSFKSRAERAVFADHLIGVWGRDFEFAWPAIYELLHIIEEDELYRDWRRVGPKAPGGPATHGERSSYESFAEYFADRINKPLASWAELEATYHYAQTYGPELFRQSFTDAKAKLGKHGGDRVRAQDNCEQVGINSNLNDTKLQGNTNDYLTARLERDAPTIAAELAQGKHHSVHAAAVTAGIRKRSKPKPITMLRYWWKHATPEDREAFIREVK